MAATEINLIKQNTSGVMEYVGLYEQKMRVVAWWMLIGLFISGVTLGIMYYSMQNNSRTLQDQKDQISQQLKAAIVKEGMVYALKQRIEIVQKSMNSARPWGKVFSLLTQISSIESFEAFTADDTGRVSTTLTLVSMDDAVGVVANAMSLVSSKTIRSPQLVSLSMNEKGIVQLGLSFVPIF